MPLLATVYGENLLRFMAQMSVHGWWLGFWKAVAFLGDAAFFTLALPLVHATMPWPRALRLTAVFGVASFSSEWIKAVTVRPRPDPSAFGLDQGLEHFGEFESHAFPSGHAMSSSASWGWFGFRQPRRWLRVAVVILVLLISISRLALLRHDLLDVGAGLLLGVLVLFAMLGVDRWLTPHLARLPWAAQSTLWLLTGGVLAALAGIHSGHVIAGVVSGLGAGACWAGGRERTRRPEVRVSALRFVLGLLGAVVVRGVGVAFLAEASFLQFGLYFVAGFWVSGILPVLTGGAFVDQPGSSR